MEYDSSLSYVGHMEGEEYTYWRGWKLNSWVETFLPLNFVRMGKCIGFHYLHVSSWDAWFLYLHYCLDFFSLLSLSTLPVCPVPFFFIILFDVFQFQWSLLLIKKIYHGIKTRGFGFKSCLHLKSHLQNSHAFGPI